MPLTAARHPVTDLPDLADELYASAVAHARALRHWRQELQAIIEGEFTPEARAMLATVLDALRDEHATDPTKWLIDEALNAVRR